MSIVSFFYALRYKNKPEEDKEGKEELERDCNLCKWRWQFDSEWIPIRNRCYRCLHHGKYHFDLKEKEN